MDIAVTTILLFAVFGMLLFRGMPNFCQYRSFINCNGLVFSVVGSDYIYHHAENERRSGEFFTVGCTAVSFLAGNIMNNGGIARRLVNFAKLFCGWIPGSLAQANVLGNMLFGALSGSAVAASSAMGGCIYPIQKEEGYDPAFATAVNIASAPTGLLIPPTSAFIVYSTVAGGVSISALFMAGYIPGILDGARNDDCCLYLCEETQISDNRIRTC